MEPIITMLKNRRGIVGIVMAVMTILAFTGVIKDIDSKEVADIIAGMAESVAYLISSCLSLHSLFTNKNGEQR